MRLIINSACTVTAKKKFTPVAKGHVTTIYTELTEDGELQSKPLPQVLLNKIEEAPQSVLRPDGTEE